MEEPASTAADAEHEVAVAYAGPRQRLIAFLVDGLMMVAVGYAIGFELFDWAMSLGQLGVWLGFAIAAVYYVPSGTALTGGRTLGKYLLGTRLQSTQGQAVSWGRSLGRFVAFALPPFLLLSGIDAFEPSTDTLPWSWALTSGIALFLAGSVYLFALNRPTRQTVHDLVAQTVVVTAVSGRAAAPASLAEWHRAALICVPGVTLTGLTWLGPGLTAADPLELERTSAARYLDDFGDVADARIAEQRAIDGGRERRIVELSATGRVRPQGAEDAAVRLVKLAAGRYPGLRSADAVRVRFRWGFNLGIARAWHSTEFMRAPSEWLPKSEAGSVRRADPAATPNLRQPTIDAGGAQVAAAIRLAEPARRAVTRYLAAHGGMPAIDAVWSAAELAPTRTRGAEVTVDAHGTVRARLVGGALDGRSVWWIPIGVPPNVRWACLRGDIPMELLDSTCGLPAAPSRGEKSRDRH